LLKAIVKLAFVVKDDRDSADAMFNVTVELFAVCITRDDAVLYPDKVELREVVVTPSVMPKPDTVVGLEVKDAKVCAWLLPAASVMPYPARVVGLLVSPEKSWVWLLAAASVIP
jgi:hypothetical protein